jgi:hypothetical protein
VTGSKKKSPAQFILEIESIRLSNWFIRMAWRATALLFVLTARLLTSIVLALLGTWRRNRILR